MLLTRIHSTNSYVHPIEVPLESLKGTINKLRAKICPLISPSLNILCPGNQFIAI